jgi:Flp pilus assembly protein TadG
VDAYDFGSYQQAKVGRERHVAVDHHQSAQRGFVLIWVGLGMLLFLGIAALVIDAGYLYLTKKQLSVAADSGALAGATQIFKTTDCATASGSPNYNARLEARKFAGYHKAGTGSGQTTVDLALNDASNDGNGDIVLGNFNRTLTPHFLPCSTTAPTGRPTNAVRVRARRTGEGGDGIATNNRVSTFFAGVLNSDFKTSGVGAYATAQKVTKSGWPVALPLCSIPPAGTPGTGGTCCPKKPDGTYYNCTGSGNSLTFSPTNLQNACWTSFFKPKGSDIKDYVNDPLSIPCTGASLPSANLNLSNGAHSDALMALQAACLSHGCSVATPWPVQFPVIDVPCAPLSCTEDGPIVGFVTLDITSVDAGGTQQINGTFNCGEEPIGKAECSALVE